MKFTFKGALAAGSLLAGLGVGAAAQATDVTINSTGIYNPGTINISGPQAASEWSTAVEFDTTIGGLPETLYAFCVDLTHVIYVNNPGSQDIVSAQGNNQRQATLNYATGALTADSVGSGSGMGGTPLSATQVKDISGLADYGVTLIDHALSGGPYSGQTLSDELAAIQGAIWTIEYPLDTFTAPDITVAHDMATAVAAAPNLALHVRETVQALYPVDGASQGFVIGSPFVGLSGPLGGFGAVPEPASWGLMLAGFGVSGMVLRRRRSNAKLVMA